MVFVVRRRKCIIHNASAATNKKLTDNNHSDCNVYGRDVYAALQEVDVARRASNRERRCVGASPGKQNAASAAYLAKSISPLARMPSPSASDGIAELRHVCRIATHCSSYAAQVFELQDVKCSVGSGLTVEFGEEEVDFESRRD